MKMNNVIPFFAVFPLILMGCTQDEVIKEDINPEKPDVPLNKNDAFQKVQKRRVQEKR